MDDIEEIIPALPTNFLFTFDLNISLYTLEPSRQCKISHKFIKISNQRDFLILLYLNIFLKFSSFSHSLGFLSSFIFIKISA